MKKAIKADFHMIADRGSQIADHNKVCDRLRSYGNYFCDRLSAILGSRSQTIAEGRTMFYLKAGFHMIADDRRPYCDLRSAIIWKPAFSATGSCSGSLSQFFLPYLGPGFVLVKTGVFFPSTVAPELNVKQLPYLQFHVCFQYRRKSLWSDYQGQSAPYLYVSH